MNFEEQAAVHPRTVTALSQQPAQPKTRRFNGRRPATSVSHLQVNPALWAAALERCGGDPRRIRVISATEVVIENAPAR